MEHPVSVKRIRQPPIIIITKSPKQQERGKSP